MYISLRKHYKRVKQLKLELADSRLQTRAMFAADHSAWEKEKELEGKLKEANERLVILTSILPEEILMERLKHD